jgi:hypothetical protein
MGASGDEGVEGVGCSVVWDKYCSGEPATGEPTTLGFEVHSPILIFSGDCRIKFGGVSDLLRLTEGMFGATKH